MKQLKIMIKIEDGKIASIINKEGYPDNVSSLLELVGVFENLKQQHLNKLNLLLKKDL